MKKVYHRSSSNQWLCTLTIGEKYLAKFEAFYLPFALDYAKRNHLNLCTIVDDITDTATEAGGKKKTWQKFLIPSYLMNEEGGNISVCYFDSDVMINPFGKNIFNYHVDGKFSIVSEVNGLPYNDFFTKKVLSFKRNKYYSNKYPLDSAIFMSPEQIYKYHGLEPFQDYACAGLFVCESVKDATVLKDGFYSYHKDVETITDGGDEPIFNYVIRKNLDVHNLGYEFQALWSMEMANKYSFLFDSDRFNSHIEAHCIASCLLSVSFLHFAGSWNDARLSENKEIYRIVSCQENQEFDLYMKKKPLGHPVGRILPS